MNNDVIKKIINNQSFVVVIINNDILLYKKEEFKVENKGQSQHWPFLVITVLISVLISHRTTRHLSPLPL